MPNPKVLPNPKTLTRVSRFVMLSFLRSPRRKGWKVLKGSNSVLVQLHNSRSWLEGSNQLPVQVHPNSPKISQCKFNPMDQNSIMSLASQKNQNFLMQKVSEPSVKNLHVYSLNSICLIGVWVKTGQRCWFVINQHRASITHSKILLNSLEKFEKILCKIAALNMLIFHFEGIF